MDLRSLNRILVVKLRHIGDVLLTTPTLRALKKAMPDARITVVVPAGTEDMLTLNPNVDEVVLFRKGQGFFAEMGLLRKIRAGRFDLAINMTEGDRGAILCYLSGARIRVGIDPGRKGLIGKRRLFTHLVKWEYDGRHRVLMEMEVLKPLGIEPGEPAVEIFTSGSDEEYVTRLLTENGITGQTPFAVLHPTSRWIFKCWRDEAVASVMDYLESRGLRVVVTCGPDKKEMEKAGHIISLASSRPVDLMGRLSLKQFASLCGRARIFFGVDTAPMHIAAAVGTPVVALFGPSDPREWGPFSKRTAVLTADGFPCMPCRRAGCDGNYESSRCVEAVTEQEAIKAVEDILCQR